MNKENNMDCMENISSDGDDVKNFEEVKKKKNKKTQKQIDTLNSNMAKGIETKKIKKKIIDEKEFDDEYENLTMKNLESLINKINPKIKPPQPLSEKNIENEKLIDRPKKSKAVVKNKTPKDDSKTNHMISLLESLNNNIGVLMKKNETSLSKIPPKTDNDDLIRTLSMRIIGKQII